MRIPALSGFCLVVFGTTAMHFAARPSAAVPTIPDPVTPGPLQDRIRGALDKAAAMVVRISTSKPDEPAAWVSGVIISADGWVATCAHHRKATGEKVMIRLADGREVPATAAGRNERWDIGLFRLTGPGPWPAINRGRSEEFRKGEPCLLLAHPSNHADNRLALARLVRVHDASGTPARLVVEGLSIPGDSGGPLIDLDGRLIGVVSTGTGYEFTCAGAELFEAHWTDLTSGKDNPWVGSPGDRVGGFRRALEEGQKSCIGVAIDGRTALLGTIVGADGWVLTKASELRGAITVVLPDGRSVPAKMAAEDRHRDLALLKAEAVGLIPVVWAKGDDVTVGSLVAAVILGRKPDLTGIVAHSTRAVKPVNGIPPLKVVNSKDGVRVAKLNTSVLDIELKNGPVGPLLLKTGDIVTHVNAIRVPDVKTWDDLMFGQATEVGGRPRIAGERFALTIIRDGVAQKLDVILGSLSGIPGPNYVNPLSPRRSGFPAVFSADLGLPADKCGGPVIDQSGHVVGVSLAVASFVETYVVPANEARKAIEELLAAAKKR
jgi:serine protease Do